jgi:serine/threonine protein kinase
LLLNQKLSEKEYADFKGECELMMTLRPHRNGKMGVGYLTCLVVPLLGVCIDTKKPLCLITDFVGMLRIYIFIHLSIENGSLEKLIKSNYIIPWKMVLDIAKGIQAGVYHLHQEKILHRDLAARNILLRANYEPLIADFGLSKLVSLSLEKNSPKDDPNVKTKETEAFRGPYKWCVLTSCKRY